MSRCCARRISSKRLARQADHASRLRRVTCNFRHVSQASSAQRQQATQANKTGLIDEVDDFPDRLFQHARMRIREEPSDGSHQTVVFHDDRKTLSATDRDDLCTGSASIACGPTGSMTSIQHVHAGVAERRSINDEPIRSRNNSARVQKLKRRGSHHNQMVSFCILEFRASAT